MKLIDKDTVMAEIKRRITTYKNVSGSDRRTDALISFKNFLDTLEVKEVVAEQEGVCHGIFNRIIGGNWNLSIPLDKVGLKHGDKVKIFITKEK